jgi:hypothetical protein
MRFFGVYGLRKVWHVCMCVYVCGGVIVGLRSPKKDTVCVCARVFAKVFIITRQNTTVKDPIDIEGRRGSKGHIWVRD